jgi:antitoxin component HigA of HigAB toxin-antitoxin module
MPMHAIAERDYMQLVRRFPLHSIRSKSEHRQALAIVAELSAKGDAKLTSGEIDYLDALGRFVHDFEINRTLTMLGHATPLEVLRHLMESRGMTPADLGDVLGSRSAATMILKEQREMSKSHIRAAADYFGISPSVFL